MNKYIFRIFILLIFLQSALAKGLVYQSINTSKFIIEHHNVSKGIPLESTFWYDNFILDEDEEYLATEKKSNPPYLLIQNLSHFRVAKFNNHALRFKGVVNPNNTGNPLYIMWSILLI
jgi:hypothetical protein